MNKLEQVIKRTIESEIYKQRETTISLCDIVNATIITIKHQLSNCLMKSDFNRNRNKSFIEYPGEFLFKTIVDLERDLDDKHYPSHVAYAYINKLEQLANKLKYVIDDKYLRNIFISINNALIELNLFFRDEIDYGYRYTRGHQDQLKDYYYNDRPIYPTIRF